MSEHQPGIFARGASEHCYIELDLADASAARRLATCLADLLGPASVLDATSAVVGFRPELWHELDPGSAPADVRSFETIHGSGLTMPTTQHDAWVWLAGGSREVVFDNALAVVRSLADTAVVSTELTGWVYRDNRDLTGFIDGTENPTPLDAPAVAITGSGPASGSSVLLFQKWRHLPSWVSLTVREQELVIGRTKADSVELDASAMPADSHVARNVIEEDGAQLAIFRRNTSYGGPTHHGTVFVGFCASQHPLQRMLESMAGVGDGIRDALTRHTEPLSGSYYVIPSLGALSRFATPDDEG